jgi:ABC-type lipoprotein release transport system permease subunit
MGRLIAPEDVPPLGPANVAVLTFEFWQAEFGGDTEVLGQTVTLEERTYEIIGVLPQETRVPRLDYARAWLPLPFDPADEENRDWRGFRAWARLAPGVTLEEAQLELASIQRALVEEHPEVLAGSGVEVRRMRDYLVENARTTLLVFAAAVFVVLLIVSVNVASLLLAHATSREREFVVRTALGATRSSLARQLLVESGVLAGMGGLGGIVVGFWATDAFLHLAPSGIPRIGEVHVDARILAFAVLATGIAGIVFGLAPLARLWRMNVATRLRESHRLTGSWGTQRTRRTLVVAQLTRRAENELAVIPGVRTVGTASAGPLFGGGDGTTPFQIEGQATLSLDEAPTVAWYDVSPNYFSTLGVALQSGRHLSESDLRGTAPVAIVNAAFARRFWPSGSPVGERITLPNLNHSVEIVGVVGNIQPFNPGDDAEPEIYFSNRQWTRWATYFVLRTDIDPTTIASPVGTTLAAIDPELVPSRVMTLPQLAAQERVGPRFNLALVGLFAIVALLLAAVGTYGVLAYTVALRRHEIGIRMALGADGSRIVRWIGTEGIKIIGLGTVLGVIGAMALARFLEGMLLGVATTDILAYAGPAVLLIAAGGVACLIPAMRATRIQPTEAIRED